MIIPVLNEERDIERVLNELKDQVPPPGNFEVIVVDGGSTDRTRDIVGSLSKNWPPLRLLANPGKLSSRGRNVGIKAASGGYLVFIDGHCSIPTNDYLRRMVELFKSTGADCLCRPQPLLKLAEGKWGRAIASARHSFFGHNAVSDIYGGSPNYTDPRSAGAAYVREVLEQLGGYDERFDACEDVELNYRVARAGFKSYRHPDLTVHYRPRSSLQGLFLQMIRYGRGRARLMARHPATAPWPLLLITSIVAVGIGLQIAGAGEALAYLLGILGGLWLVLIVIESLRLGGFSLAWPRIVLTFFAIYSGLTLGFWGGLLESLRFRGQSDRENDDDAAGRRPSSPADLYRAERHLT